MVGAARPTTILGMDTAMAACSAAIWRSGKVVAHRHRAQARGHAESLMPMVAELFAEAHCTVKDMDRLAVTIGPGTFTGQRVGLAAARAMVLGNDIALLGLTTLQVVAAGAACLREADAETPLFSVFDARRGEVYVQGFTAALAELTPAAVLTPPDAASLIAAHAGGRAVLVGSGKHLVAADLQRLNCAVRLSAAPDNPDARHVVRLAALMPPPTGPAPTPLYLRPADAKLPAPRGG